MAQVIKYQQGGSTPQKYGTFIIDGNRIEVNDEFLNQMINYGKSLDDDTAYQFSKITDALKSGKDLSYDSNANQLSGSVQFDVTNRQNTRLGKRRSRLGNIFGSSWRGQENASRNAISALKGFNYTKPIPTGTNYDWSSDINVEYERGDDGQYKLVDGKRVFIQGANNLRARRRLEALKDVANYTSNDTFKGYSNLDKQAYIDLYNRLGKEGVMNLIQRVEDGTWTNNDKMILDDIGIFLDPKQSSSTDETNENNTDRELQEKFNRLSSFGFSNPETASKYVVIDNNGVIRTTDLFNQTFGTKNAIYNDWWQQSLSNNNQWNPDFSFLNGYTRIGDRLYRTSDLNDKNSELYKFAHQDGGFYDLNTRNRFNDANNILEYLWGNPDESSVWDKTKYYSPWLNNQDSTFRYRSLTGIKELPNGQQLIEYWTGNERDQFGRPLYYKYALLDANGNLIQDDVDINVYNDIPEGEQVGLHALSRIYQPDSPYHGRYVTTFSDPSGSITNYSLYTNPDNPNDIILQSDELNRWNASEGKNIRVPEELANMINQNPNFWNNLMQDKTLQNRFTRSLVEGVRTQTGDALTTMWPFSTSTLEIKDWEKLGFTPEQARYLYDYMENTWGDRNNESLWKRRNQRLVIPYQKGGVIGTTKEATGSNKDEKISTYKDPKKVAGSQDNWNLSHADKLQIASIAGDVAALIAAIPTGGNPVAGALGYGSSLTQFGADISRDGFQLGDLGSLALNLGLDTVSLLPGIGISGKIGKTAKIVKKSAGLLKKALLANGAYNAAKAATNIASGNATLDDWKALSTGLFAIKGIKNEVQNIKATQYKGGAPKVKGVSKEDLKHQYVNKLVASKDLGKVDGQPTRWANPDGTVKNYEQAISDLTKSGHLKITKAQEAKWAAEAAKSKATTSIKNTFSGSYNPFSSNYKFNTSNRQLPSNFDLKDLTGNTSKLRTIGRLINQNPEIAEQLKNQRWLMPEVLNFSSNHGGNWFYRSPVFSRFVRLNPSNQLLLPPSSGVRDIPVTLSGVKNPTIIINKDPYLQSVDDYIGLKFHKKGGKIVKASNGIFFQKSWFRTPKIEVPELKISKLDDLKRENLIGNNPLLETIVSERNNPSIASPELVARATNNLQTIGPIKPLSENDIKQDYYGGSDKKFNWSISPDMVLGIGDFITSARGINRSTQKMKDAIHKGMIGSQQQLPTEFYTRFSDNGLHRMYDDRIKTMRQSKTDTSDSRQLMAEKLMRDSNVDQLIGDRDTKFSQMIDEYNNKVLSQKQQYAAIRNQITNENRNRWYQGLAQLDMADANNIEQQTQNVKNLIYQLRQNYAQDLAQRTQIEDKLSEMNAETNFQNKLKELFESKGGFGSMTTEESDQFKNDWIGYTNYKWTDEVANIRNQAYFDIYQSQANDPKRRFSWLNWFRRLNMTPYQNRIISNPQPNPTIAIKNGGKVQRFRDVGEQAYLDQQKAINKAVNDLNNNIIKLFLKMMS